MKTPNLLKRQLTAKLERFSSETLLILIFGSLANDNFLIGSDVDLLIVSDNDSIKAEIMDVLDNFHVEKGISYDLIFLTKEQFDMQKSTLLIEMAMKEGFTIWEKKENRLNRAEAHLERAQKSIKAGKELNQVGLYEDSISRSYNGIYHSVLALIVSIGEDARTHKGVFHILYTKFVKTNHVSSNLNKKINRILSLRSDADYGIIPVLDAGDAEFGSEVSIEINVIAKKWLQELQSS